MNREKVGTVLVVDDIEENLKVLTETLIQAGFHPLQAKSGERALEIAKKANPDIILLDIKMPGMDGYQTIRALKEDPATEPIPVIFISALNQIEDKVKGFTAGAVDYVSKPFQKEEVLARVGTHLRLRQALQTVEEERAKSDNLLLALLPAPVASELREHGACESRSFPDVSILFADLAGFTTIAAGLDPKVLIAELNELVSSFDTIMETNHCERIKTIGDAYFAVCGMPESDPAHAEHLVQAARDMLTWLSNRNKTHPIQWELRIGIHSGAVVAGIVGTRRYIYDVFGDSVNIASRLESASEPMKINISATTRALLGDSVSCSSRGTLPVKGRGDLEMFWVDFHAPS